MKVMLLFSRDEIEREIPYMVICETRYGSRWNTAKRARLWDELFNNSEKHAAVNLFALARRWTRNTGVPEEVMMSQYTFMLWKKLGVFCASI